LAGYQIAPRIAYVRRAAQFCSGRFVLFLKRGECGVSRVLVYDRRQPQPLLVDRRDIQRSQFLTPEDNSDGAAGPD